MEAHTPSSPGEVAQAEVTRGVPAPAHPGAAPLGPTLVLTATFAVGVLLFAIAALFAVDHPEHYLVVYIPLGIAEQNQGAKTAVYVLSVIVLLPLSVALVPRVLDRVAVRAGDAALRGLSALIPAGLALAVLLTRISGVLPWGDGLVVLAVALGVWLAASLALVRASTAGRAAAWLAGLAPAPLGAFAAVAVLAALVCPTKPSSVQLLPALLGGAGLAAAIALVRRPVRVDWRRLPGWSAPAFEVIFALGLTLAILPTIVIDPSVGLPNLFSPPGIVAYHQDFLLGPANQLLHGGGALMVDVPISQYGVGPIYLIYALFHVLPIGYGSFGLLDGVLTALFYLGGYWLLRAAGVGRALAAGAILVAMLALVYDFRYPVGELPQQGPLRFGLPIVVLLGFTAAARSPRYARAGRIAAYLAVGLSAVWALEGFAYTLLTLGAILAVETALAPPSTRGRWLGRELLAVVAVCAGAHLLLALATLVATGQLPDWGEYGTYIHTFLLGGGASKDVYGFEPWSPGLAVAAGTTAAAVLVPLVLWRARALAQSERPTLVATAGLTALAVALLSYTDNRSSTYLLTYIALPLALIVTLWVSLLIRRRETASLRPGALAVVFALAAVLLVVAWPAMGTRFSRSALAHAYPGGGLGARARALTHDPPVDPRAPLGEALVRRYLPGRRVLLITPVYPDMATEILMRTGRASMLFSGDPKADSYVPSIWTGRVGRQLDALPAGTLALMDRSALAELPLLRAQPGRDLFNHPIGLGDPEVEWVLRRLAGRFDFAPVHIDAATGLRIVRLVARGA